MATSYQLAQSAILRPVVTDLQGDNVYAATARQHWLKKSSTKFDSRIVTQLFTSLQQDGWSYKSMLILENLQYLESYLWPNFNVDSTDNHVLSIALMMDIKRRENLPLWNLFTDCEAIFAQFFRRILILALDSTLSLNIKARVVSFIITAFQSLDHPVVRKQCAPLVSISLWQYIGNPSVRDMKLEKQPQFKKVWRAATKRYEASDEKERAKINFESSWLFLLISEFFNTLHASEAVDLDRTMYCERVVELLTDLLSQLPTRRYVKYFLEDLHVIVVIRSSPVYQNPSNGVFRDMHNMFSQMLYFAVDESSSSAQSDEEMRLKHYEELGRLQKLCVKHFKHKLTLLALSNLASIENREDMSTHLSGLNDEELVELCDKFGMRTTYPRNIYVDVNRHFLLDAILTAVCKRKSLIEVVEEKPILPTEQSLYDVALLRYERYDGTRSLALPKLNLQYLTVNDFLWRAFVLYRASSYFGIRRDIEDSLTRLRPRYFSETKETRFNGSSKMAIPLSKISMLETAPPKVGEERPALVRAEVELQLEHFSEDIRRDWDDLRPDEVLFLISVKGIEEDFDVRDIDDGGLSRFDIRYVRCAEVIQMFDHENRPIHQAGRKRFGKRKLHLKLDTVAFQEDKMKELEGAENIYDTFNLILRRKGIMNNFKPVLKSIRQLMHLDSPLPNWFSILFLGYGDPAKTQNADELPRPRSLDYYDTFVSYHHLAETIGQTRLEANSQAKMEPPFVLKEIRPNNKALQKDSRKRKKTVNDADDAPMRTTFQITSYMIPSAGPYPIDVPKRNHLEYTSAQINVIMSGTNPGLTVVHGPPGTGKTDVATQIVSNIYHNFPNQRTLLIAHSNQALNQLFQKIMRLNVDERHLLRLGHGEGYLQSDQSYSKFGRVESFMENRNKLLQEVDRLANSLDVAGAHGNSCETAEYFFDVHIVPRWVDYQQSVKAENNPEGLVQGFPFVTYFSNAPQPLFPLEQGIDNLKDIAQGCFEHIKKIFLELKEIHPFEILRNAKDKANYLLTKEARIIAMTSTHAAIKRDDIIQQGFEYQNVIIEEAAQMTEIEAFIPLTLQNNASGNNLQRIILCGDHYQNSPIIQHGAFRDYANMEQSLFARLIRLGVRTVQLDQQGRARPEIAELYRWRYPFLGSLRVLNERSENLTANAGFLHQYQFINVEDYKGHGEQEPTRHFIQNLGEAEYAVAIFQYMRLLGYPASRISILATYAGQQTLIRDVLNHRCAKNPLFGQPLHVTTVDKFQGEQNDYVILSLVRTKRVGYLRDIRRITVALSRARLGLYILGRRNVFESCYELAEPFRRLVIHSDKLELVTGELWPTQRLCNESHEATEMDGVEHLGQYVFEMTNTKMKAMNKQDDTEMSEAM